MIANNNWSGPPTPTDYTTITRIPFLAWNKLEGRARSQNMDRSTRAEVYDPLWFLTRQWQLGELRGEDVGSSLTAQIAFESIKPSHVGNGKSSPLKPIETSSNYHHQHPVAAMKYLMFTLTLQQRAHAGKYFLQLCREAGTYGIAQLTAIISEFPIQIPEPPNASNWSDQMNSSRYHAQAKLASLSRLYKNRIPDGLLIYLDLKSSTPSLNNVAEPLKNDYINFIEKLYPQLQETESTDSWSSENLGYDFKWAYPKESNGSVDHLVLGNRATATEGADWYNADVLNVANEEIITPVTEIDNYRESKVFEVVLSRVKYAGMPAKRWWEMEEGKIDLGSIEGDKTEAVKQILTEFSSLHSNDWFMIPFKRKEHELVTVKGILVKDIFGEYTYIKNTLSGDLSASEFSDDGLNSYDWNLFHHDVAAEAESILNNTAGNSLHSSFLLGSARTVASSEPVERIEFIRDEMDNRVWAVESVVASQLGGGLNGATISEELIAYLRQLTGDVEEVNPTDIPLIYKLGTTLPENYIPFVPVRDGSMPAPFSSRSIALQRGWLPRTVGDSNTRVRPRTRLLRWNINEDDQLLDDIGNPIITGTQGNPLLGVVQTANLTSMLLKEELIPRSGLTITDRYYYGRDYNGGLHLWLGRSVKNGTEASSAQLSFDSATVKKSQQL